MKQILLGAAVLLAGWAAAAAPARELTAYEVVREANRSVGEHVRDKVVRIRSEKSTGGLTPSIWFVEYYDITARMKCTEVKIGGGKMLDVRRPMRVLSTISGPEAPLDREKLKVDSDKALKIALKEPLLQNVTVKAVSLKLEQSKADGVVWIVKLWAAKVKTPGEEASIGEIQLSATDAKVIKTDLNLSRVN